MFPFCKLLAKAIARIRRNVCFHVPANFESFRFLGEEKPWNFIYLRSELGSVESWPVLYQKIYQYAAALRNCPLTTKANASRVIQALETGQWRL